MFSTSAQECPGLELHYISMGHCQLGPCLVALTTTVADRLMGVLVCIVGDS